MIDQNAPEFLQTANKFGIKLGLERMNSLLEKLSHPEKHLSAFHIAGTNGKGSVSAYCTSMLAWDGKKVGLYTSPFLERFSERIRIIDGREGLLSWEKDDTYGEIDPDSLRRLSDLVESKVKELLEEGQEHPTEFELVTAVAFLYFAEKNCDVVVLETGLGGRLDSTNVIEKPEACIITALGYDHTDRLGNTLGEIAGEKGGIIKKGCPVFAMDTYQREVLPEEAEQAKIVLEKIAKEKNAPLTWNIGNRKICVSVLLPLLFSVAVLFSFTANSHAAGGVTVNLAFREASAQTGEIVTLDVSFSSFPSITRFGPIEIGYDTSALEFLGIRIGEDLEGFKLDYDKSDDDALIRFSAINEAAEESIMQGSSGSDKKDPTTKATDRDAVFSTDAPIVVATLEFRIREQARGEVKAWLGTISGLRDSALENVVAGSGTGILRILFRPMV